MEKLKHGDFSSCSSGKDNTGFKQWRYTLLSNGVLLWLHVMWWHWTQNMWRQPGIIECTVNNRKHTYCTHTYTNKQEMYSHCHRWRNPSYQPLNTCFLFTWRGLNSWECNCAGSQTKKQSNVQTDSVWPCLRVMRNRSSCLCRFPVFQSENVVHGCFLGDVLCCVVMKGKRVTPSKQKTFTQTWQHKTFENSLPYVTEQAVASAVCQPDHI